MDNFFEFNEVFFMKFLLNIVVIVIFFIVGIFGNFLVIYVYEFCFLCFDGWCYIGLLVVFDFGILILIFVLNLLKNLMKFIFFGLIVCKCLYFFSYVFINILLFLWIVIVV